MNPNTKESMSQPYPKINIACTLIDIQFWNHKFIFQRFPDVITTLQSLSVYKLTYK